MRPLRFAALTCALLTTLVLTSCDNDDKPQAAGAPAASSQPAATQPGKVLAPDKAERDRLAAQSEGKALTLLDASEVQLDGAAALVLTFSVPLDPDQDFSSVVHLVDKKSGKVDGA